MLRNLRILAVDDDEDVLELVEAYLVDKGFIVETRRNAREALDVLRDHDIDLVLSDIRMAGMTGFELLTAARAAHPEIGIVLMTAHADEYPMSQALRAGADGYLTKPFSLQKLSLIFEESYWRALSRHDWWERHAAVNG